MKKHENTALGLAKQFTQVRKQLREAIDSLVISIRQPVRVSVRTEQRIYKARITVRTRI